MFLCVHTKNADGNIAIDQIGVWIYEHFQIINCPLSFDKTLVIS